MLKNLIGKINLFAKIKAFLDANPQKAKFIGIVMLALIIPLTVVAALTVQNLRQHAGGGSVVNLTDQSRNTLFSTSDPNVFIDLNINNTGQVIQGPGVGINNLVTRAFAVSAGCTPPYSGYLGCLSADSAPSGSACTGSCTADNGQTGQYCYLSTRVGNSCTDNYGSSGTCDTYGDCNHTTSGGSNVCNTSIDCTGAACTPRNYNTCGATNGLQVCRYTKFNNGSTISSDCTPLMLDNQPCHIDNCASGYTCTNGSCVAPYTAPPAATTCSSFSANCEQCVNGNVPGGCSWFPGRCVSGTSGQNSCPTNTAPATPTPVFSPTPSSPSTPAPNILKAIYIENKDTDGSTGGSAPTKITINSASDITHIPWKLNDLLPGQTQAPRTVQVTLIGDNLAVPFATTINLVNQNTTVSSPATTLNPNVFILEDDGTFEKIGILGITKKFYEKYPDVYDFIAIQWSRGGGGGGGGGTAVRKVAQQGSISGVELDQTAEFGSKGKLLGVYEIGFGLDPSFVKRDPNNDPIALINNFYFALLFHELTHTWGVNLPPQLKDAAHKVGNDYDRAHWEGLVGSWLSVGIGSSRQKYFEKYGKYYFINDVSKEPKQNDFDLYFMGLKSPEEIKEKLVVANLSGDNLSIPTGQSDVAVEVPPDMIRKAFTIQDFIKVLGPRIPSVADSQKDFKIAFITIVPKGEILNQKQIDATNWIADKFPVTWYKSTEGRSTLNGIRPKDTTPPIISNVKTSATQSSISVSLTTNESATTFVIYTPTLQNGFRYPISIIYPNVITNPPTFSTDHKITIHASDWTPFESSNLEYSIKVISIDKDYNMASFDAGNVKTTENSISIPASTPINIAPTVNVNYDLSGDGVVNCKDMKVLVSQYGQEGANLSADFNHDRIVNGTDLNMLVKNSNPGDTTKCL